VIAAEAKCGLDCTGRCPHHVDTECPKGDTCVVQDGGYFDQCINCSPDAYQSECIYLSDEMRAAADEACGLTCVMPPPTKLKPQTSFEKVALMSKSNPAVVMKSTSAVV
jgi:hypothetical protein